MPRGKQVKCNKGRPPCSPGHVEYRMSDGEKCCRKSPQRSKSRGPSRACVRKTHLENLGPFYNCLRAAGSIKTADKRKQTMTKCLALVPKYSPRKLTPGEKLKPFYKCLTKAARISDGDKRRSAMRSCLPLAPKYPRKSRK